MATQQRDYILRLIEELRRFAAEIAKFRSAGNLDAALMAVVHAQQRLFARPADQFMGLPPDEQFRLLTISEPVDAAAEKCLAYASLMEEAAKIYDERDQQPIAVGARNAAAQMLALVIAKFGDSTPERVKSEFERLGAGPNRPEADR